MKRTLALFAEPFRELTPATLLDEARTAAIFVVVVLWLNAALRILP